MQKEDSSRQRHLSSSWVLWPLGLLALCFLLPYIYSVIIWWPPIWMERRTQRHQILERVKSVGGWNALKRNCDALADKYKDSEQELIWYWPETNGLPPEIAALHPKRVYLFPRRVVKQFRGDALAFFGNNSVVRIDIFGAHATGGRDQAWLGLDVVCEPGVINYSPQRLRSKNPLRYWTYRKVTDDVYEFY